MVRIRRALTPVYSRAGVQEGEVACKVCPPLHAACKTGSSLLAIENHDLPAADVAARLGIAEGIVEAAYRDIEQKRRTTRYLHERPLRVEEIPEITA
jgi:hypothetical protein